MAACNFERIQSEWTRYVQQAYQMCDREFWLMFDTVKEQSATVAQRVLKQSFKLAHNKVRARRWPQTMKTLWRMVRKAGDFWSNVIETCQIDMRHFGLPGLDKVTFEYVDPIYVWIKQCEIMAERGEQIHWEPEVLQHPDTGEHLYGAGIQRILNV